MRKKWIKILIIFLVLCWSGPLPVQAESEQSIPADNPPGYRHLIYSLKVVEIDSTTARKMKLDSLQINHDNGPEQANFIFRDELEQVDYSLKALESGENITIISRPQITVIPGKTGSLTASEQELQLAGGDAEGAIIDRIFKLELTPSGRGWQDDGRITTRIQLKTGTGLSGLNTEIVLKKGQSSLLGIIRTDKYSSIIDEQIKTKYFAVYLTVNSGGVITLPDFCGSVRGLEELFSPLNPVSPIHQLSLIVHNNTRWAVSLSGELQLVSGKMVLFDFNQPVSYNNEIGIKDIIRGRLEGGIKVITADHQEYLLAIMLEDRQQKGPLQLKTGIQPVINIENSKKDIWWYLELEKYNNPKVSLAYSSEGEVDYGEIKGALQLDDNKQAILGYKWEIGRTAGHNFWMGLAIGL